MAGVEKALPQVGRKIAMIVHVIDDDDGARDSVAFLLATAGFRPRTYESATAFLGELGSAEAGVIVSDWRMPEVNGLDLMRRLNHQRIDWPVIIITGQGDVGVAVESIKAGALDFIEKPFNDEELLAVVRSAFSADRFALERLDLIKERLNALSVTERQVATALTEGRPSFAIAEALAISPRRVEICRANVLTKMQAKSLSHLVHMMMLANRGI
jgi:two-component system response regulator FixJ